MDTPAKEKIIKVQLPIGARLKEIGEKLAAEEGLSSYQELLRYWTKQASKGNLFVDSKKARRIALREEYDMMVKEAEVEYKAGNLKGYSSGKDLVEALEKEIESEEKKEEGE